MCPGDGYIWTPGYWGWANDDYYWAPGTWVMPPEVGYLWTPGYWGWGGAGFMFNEGYWGPVSRVSMVESTTASDTSVMAMKAAAGTTGISSTTRR